LIFERIGYFFDRLEEYTGMPNVMAALKGIMVEIMAEVLKIFGFMTKEMKQGRTSESIRDNPLPVADSGSERFVKDFWKKLIGSDIITDALNRLGELTHEEVNTVIVQILKATDRIEGGVGAARGELKAVGHKVDRLIKGTFGTLACSQCHLKHLRMTRWKGQGSSSERREAFVVL
jgi:hypothetical protein